MFTSSYCITWTCTISVNMQAPYWTEFGRKWSKWSWTSTCTVNQVLARWSTITGTLSVQMFTSSYCITWTCTISVNMQAPYWTEFGRKWSKWSWTSTCTVNQVLGRWSTITGTLSVQMFTSSYCITWTCTISVNMQAPYCEFGRNSICPNVHFQCITWTCTISVNMQAPYWTEFGRKWSKWSWNQLAQSRSWLGDPPLQKLYLSKCSLPATAWTCTISVNMQAPYWTEFGWSKWKDSTITGTLPATASLELVQSLSTCRHLTELNLGENDLNEAGHQLAQSIRSWGDDPPLQELYLSKCLLPATASLELVQSLSTCRHLTVLDLEDNK